MDGKRQQFAIIRDSWKMAIEKWSITVTLSLMPFNRCMNSVVERAFSDNCCRLCDSSVYTKCEHKYGKKGRRKIKRKINMHFIELGGINIHWLYTIQSGQCNLHFYIISNANGKEALIQLSLSLSLSHYNTLTHTVVHSLSYSIALILLFSLSPISPAI